MEEFSFKITNIVTRDKNIANLHGKDETRYQKRSF